MDRDPDAIFSDTSLKKYTFCIEKDVRVMIMANVRDYKWKGPIKANKNETIRNRMFK